MIVFVVIDAVPAESVPPPEYVAEPNPVVEGENEIPGLV
jgi:hypothetical protein